MVYIVKRSSREHERGSFGEAVSKRRAFLRLSAEHVPVAVFRTLSRNRDRRLYILSN